MKNSRQSASSGGVLRNPRDVIPAVLLCVVPLLFVSSFWVPAIWVWLPSLALTRWIVLIEHNHAHLPISFRRGVNVAVDAICAVSTGLPVGIYRIQHVHNHHCYSGTASDWSRPPTSPVQGRPLLLQKVRYHLQFMPQNLGHSWRWCLAHRDHRHTKNALIGYVTIIVCLATAAASKNTGMVGLLILPPSLISIAAARSNWRQHVGADGCYTTNDHLGYLGTRLGFNIGYHVAHHAHPSAHWSALPGIAKASTGSRDRV